MIKKLILGMMQTNCYVIYNNQRKCIVVDPGANGQKISKYIDDNGLSLVAILLTHGHFDHVGAVDYLYNKYKCSIYAHKESIKLMKDAQLNLSFYETPFVVKAPIQEVTSKMTLADYEIQWLLLEGHCQGSSMIYIPLENALMSGDVLFAGSIGRYDFPTSSHLQTKQSLEQIKELSFDARLLPGHGEESTLKYEQQNNPYLKS